MNISGHKNYKYIAFEKHFPQKVFWSDIPTKQSIVNLNVKYYELNILGEIEGISGIQIFLSAVSIKKTKICQQLN